MVQSMGFGVGIMKIGDLVRIRHNEHHGMFVVLEISKNPISMWVTIFSLNKSEKFVEMGRSLEVICK